MKKWILRASVLALAATACKKNNDPGDALPPATQDGRNAGGCFINGQPFVAADYGGSVLGSPVKAFSGGFAFDSLYFLSMNGQMNGQGVEVTLFFRGQKPGVYRFDRNTNYFPLGSPRVLLNHATYSVSGNVNETYVTDAQYIGYVTLTRAQVSQGLSAGTFEFNAVSNRDRTKTVTITNGRFDRSSL